MAEQSESVRFQVLLESALRTYEKSAGITLGDLEHPLAVQLQNCHSVDDMTALFQDQALQTVDDFRQRHRIVKSIKATVSTLTTVSSGVSDANHVGHVRQAALMVCFTSQIDFTDSIRTCENIDGRSRYFTSCMCLYCMRR
jgi:hypothetical protein